MGKLLMSHPPLSNEDIDLEDPDFWKKAVGLNQPLGFVSEEPPLELEAEEGRKKRRKRLVADADAQAEGKVTRH